VEITKGYLEQQAEALSQEAARLMTQFQRLQGAIAHCQSLVIDLEDEIPTAAEAIAKLAPELEIVEDEDEA